MQTNKCTEFYYIYSNSTKHQRLRVSGCPVKSSGNTQIYKPDAECCRFLRVAELSEFPAVLLHEM